MPRAPLDEADSILIETVKRAVKAGTGHTFYSPSGSSPIRVQAINEDFVHLEVMVGGVAGEKITLPRDIERIAHRVATLRAIARAQAGSS